MCGMKGCIAITNESGAVFNEMAAALNQQYGVSFSAFIQSRKLEEHIKSEKSTTYTDTLNQEILYETAETEKTDAETIKRLETKYGLPFLWPYLLCEKRVVLKSPGGLFYYEKSNYTHEKMLAIVHVFLKGIERFFEKNKPDFLITAGIGSLSMRMLFEVAKKNGIKTLDMQVARIENRILFTEDFRRFTGAEEIFEKIKTGYRSPFAKEAEIFLQNFRNQPHTYDQTFFSFDKKARFDFLRPPRINQNLEMIWRVIARYAASFFTGTIKQGYNPLRFIAELAVKRVRMFSVVRLYEKPRLEEDFAFFPLQMEPEVGNINLSPYITNLTELARAIAKSLPLNFKLYIKEHPVMRGMRPRSYYKKLLAIPNARLIDDAFPPYPLIQRAKIIITNVSTVGWEAAILKKPVITFGEVSYNKLSSVEKCAEMEKLPLIVQKILTGFNPDEKEILDYVTAVMEDSVPFEFIELINANSASKTIEILKEPRIKFENIIGLLASKIGLA